MREDLHMKDTNVFDKILTMTMKNNFMNRKSLLLTEIFMIKADTHAMTATTSALHPDQALKAIDLC